METPPLSLVLVRAADLGAKMVCLSHSEDSFVCLSLYPSASASVSCPLVDRGTRERKKPAVDSPVLGITTGPMCFISPTI